MFSNKSAVNSLSNKLFTSPLFVTHVENMHVRIETTLKHIQIACLQTVDECQHESAFDKFEFNWSGVSLEDNENPILLTNMTRLNDSVAYVNDLEIHPDFRGRGLNREYQSVLSSSMGVDDSLKVCFGTHASYNLLKHFVVCGRFLRHEFLADLSGLNDSKIDSYPEDDLIEAFDSHAMNLVRSTWLIADNQQISDFIAADVDVYDIDGRIRKAIFYWERCDWFTKSLSIIIKNPQKLDFNSRQYFMQFIYKLVEMKAISKETFDVFYNYVQGKTKQKPYGLLQPLMQEVLANYFLYFDYES